MSSTPPASTQPGNGDSGQPSTHSGTLPGHHVSNQTGSNQTGSNQTGAPVAGQAEAPPVAQTGAQAAMQNSASASLPPTAEQRAKLRRPHIYTPPPAPAATVRRSRISPVWIIPLIALCIAAWLGYRTVSEEGPVVELTFRTADGLTAGQTQVRHKAVQLGQVETIRLSDDLQHVIVRVRMQRAALPWKEVLAWGRDRKRLTPKDQQILEVCVSMPRRVPSDLQSRHALDVLGRMRDQGFGDE